MRKNTPIFTLKHYGIYQTWENKGRNLPKIQTVCTHVPATIDIEFGITIGVFNGKGKRIDWCIDHPQITDKKGRKMAPFTGCEFIKTNDWDFYLGDTIWAPEQDKVGDWHIYIEYNDEIVIEQTFDVSLEDDDFRKQNEFWKRRGF